MKDVELKVILIGVEGCLKDWKFSFNGVIIIEYKLQRIRFLAIFRL